LAKLYGVADVKGGAMQRVTLADRRRGGVLTMAAVLASTSHPTRTNAVKRGKWILDEILGESPAPPPPNVPALEQSTAGKNAQTLRDRLEIHRADLRCFACHERMDALGLGLENYDAIGRWRDVQDRAKIDAAGKLDDQTFTTPVELKALLVQQQSEFYRAFAEKMMIYALGRGLQWYDRPEVSRIHKALQRQEGRFSVLIAEIVRSYPFRYREAADKIVQEGDIKQ
jgi:hypothetical protein